MDITVGTFNVNNLFSRYNFKGEIEAIKNDDTEVESDVFYEFGADSLMTLRTFMGKLVKGKKIEEIMKIAERINRINVDVLAVQEVEDIDMLRYFNREYLYYKYPYQTLIEGNDRRLIDVGVLSKMPIGQITSWQQAVHPDDPSQPVFGRDLLQVDILSANRSLKLFTLFNNHLKSHYTDWREEDEIAAQKDNDARRTRQSEMISEIVKSQTDSSSRFIILGDLNDPPDSPCLEPFTTDPALSLSNALENPEETRPPKKDDPMPVSPAWTHRYKESGKPAVYELYDQIWLSPSLNSKQTEAWIDRRKTHTADGSDHDPAWIKLSL
jgi:endonuclease/exonuclease/phosphatase family metal-dependent hydrolase